MNLAPRRQRAFTLIEVLVALAILGVVALLAYRATAAMTDGAVTVIKAAKNEKLIERALPHFLSRDPQQFWISGQWMTENAGGSDVAGIETIAREENGRLLQEQRENVRLLPGVHIPESILLTRDLEEAITDADLWIVAIPTVSSETPRKGEVRRGADFAVGLLESFGAKAKLYDTKGHPMVYGRFDRGPSFPTITVYNQNFVVVKERRLMELKQGRSLVRFRDVAATIEPDTVQFAALRQPVGSLRLSANNLTPEESAERPFALKKTAVRRPGNLRRLVENVGISQDAAQRRGANRGGTLDRVGRARSGRQTRAAGNLHVEAAE